MKKTYIIPNAKLICLDAEESMMFITSSSEDGLQDTGNGGDTDSNGITGSESNRRGIWGDEY